MTFLRGEHDAIKVVIDIGKQWGFGNLIDRLSVAWALSLVDNHELDIKTAWSAAGLDKERIERGHTNDQIIQWMREYTAQETGVNK